MATDRASGNLTAFGVRCNTGPAATQPFFLGPLGTQLVLDGRAGVTVTGQALHHRDVCLIDAKARTVQLYESWGKKKEASQWQAKSDTGASPVVVQKPN